MTPEATQQTNAELLPPADWKPPVGWQALFSSEELSFHPDRTWIYQRVTKVDQLILQAKTVNPQEPKEHVIKTTGLGVDWEDVELQAKLEFGRKMLGE